MLDHHAFQLERADAVVRGFEDVVGAADIGEIAVGVAHRHVAGAVAVARQRLDVAVVVLVALHQPERPGVEREADLALVPVLAVGIAEPDRVARQRPAHRSRLDLLPRAVADLGGGLGLAVAVADGQAPVMLDAVDHLGVQRLAGADHLGQVHLPGLEILLDQDTPDRRRRAEGGDPAAHQRIQQRLGGETRLVEQEHRGAGVPRREDAAPGVLGPAGRGDVEMDVAGPQAQPVHGREMADRIALVAVQDQLRLAGGAGGEIEQQRIGRPGLAVRHECGRRRIGVLVVLPARRRAADDDPRVVAGEVVELGGIRGAGDHVAHPAAGEAVEQVVAGQQRGRRHDHRAELHRRQHRLPQRHDVAQHQQHAVAAAHAKRTEVVGDPVRARRHLGERHLDLAAALVDLPQRRPLVAAGDRVEVIERPVEAFEHRPGEVAIGGGVVLAPFEQEIAGGMEGREGHGFAPEDA